ncbi:MAG: hypothetical protein SGPRY_003047 [Prymnesium sp.]
MGEQESDDILQWELDQMEKLKELATVFDWREQSALYKERLRLIKMVRQVARMTRVADTTQRARSAAPRPARISSVRVATKREGQEKGKKFANFTSARSMFGTWPYGKWLNDMEAPSGKKNWRRFISMDRATGDCPRACILRVTEKEMYFLQYEVKPEDKDQEDDEDEENEGKRMPTKRRRRRDEEDGDEDENDVAGEDENDKDDDAAEEDKGEDKDE